MHECPQNALCDACLEDRWKQLRGVAARQGEAWLAERGGPADSDLALLLALAHKRVRESNLTSDERLLERLAGVLVWVVAPALRTTPRPW